ncbi:MAG TPA: plastocyanin/azurin family copper-binding protein [Longimicrobiaceae bacterium]|nr:plastocyanin/azurin family copper-binding protein [Longimicrobiaceae bacterium]
MTQRHGSQRMTTRAPIGRGIAVVLIALAAPTGTASGQSLLERPPNLGGTWVGTPGTLQFHFMHRFEALDPPARKVVNSPGFLLALPLPARTLVGARYATNSVLVSGFPNEWEVFGRHAPLRQDAGAPLDAAIHAAYNQAAASWDGELSVAREIDRVRLIAAFRAFSALERRDFRTAVGAGAAVRLHDFVALAADLATLLERRDHERIAWSAGLQLQVPYTPHTLSIHAANTHTTTLQGASVGTIGGQRWGFEFTVPFTFSRYFGSRAGPAAATPAAVPDDGAAAEVTMTDGLAFQPATLRIRVGETVRWRNTSTLLHTVTADPARALRPESVRLPPDAGPFDSGEMRPGAAFSHTFDIPGEYRYVCLPHEGAGMIGTVIVEE